MLVFDAALSRPVRDSVHRGTTHSMESVEIAIDALALVLAGSLFAHRFATRWRRGVAAFASLVCAVASPVLMAAGSAPEWTRIVAVCALFLAFCAVASVVSAIGGAPDDDASGGLTCGDWDPHSPPGGGTDDSEPDWWPEFEREFADYVAKPMTRVSSD
jgi:hypothetical protein